MKRGLTARLVTAINLNMMTMKVMMMMTVMIMMRMIMWPSAEELDHYDDHSMMKIIIMNKISHPKETCSEHYHEK